MRTRKRSNLTPSWVPDWTQPEHESLAHWEEFCQEYFDTFKVPEALEWSVTERPRIREDRGLKLWGYLFDDLLFYSEYISFYDIPSNTHGNDLRSSQKVPAYQRFAGCHVLAFDHVGVALVLDTPNFSDLTSTVPAGPHVYSLKTACMISRSAFNDTGTMLRPRKRKIVLR